MVPQREQVRLVQVDRKRGAPGRRRPRGQRLVQPVAGGAEIRDEVGPPAMARLRQRRIHQVLDEPQAARRRGEPETSDERAGPRALSRQLSASLYWLT